MPNSSTSTADRITVADRLFGVIVLVGGIAIAMAPRSTATIVPLLCLIAFVAAYIEGLSLRQAGKLDQATSLWLAFLGFAALSSVWAADPRATFLDTLLLFLFLLQWQILRAWTAAQPLRRIRHLAYWFAIAAMIGTAFLAFEVWSDQYIRRLAIENFSFLTPPTLGKHYRINADGVLQIYNFELNRSVAAANMMLWPAMLCASSYWTGTSLTFAASFLFGGVALATAGSAHETSKIAIVVGVAVFILSRCWPRAAAGSLAVGWVVLILGVVPATLVAYNQFSLQEARWLPYSAQQRVIIWNDVSEQVKQAPWIGVGARTAYVLSEKGMKQLKDGIKHTGTMARHTHNVYLQTWYELGIVGVILMLAAGLSTLLAAFRLPDPERPFALATAGVFMAEIGSSWEIWQRWFGALFVLTAFFLALGMRSSRGRGVTKAELPVSSA